MSKYRINVQGLTKSMNRAPMTPQQLAGAVGISKQYAHDIVTGRRNLARNPALRKRIAVALDVPQHWIESVDAA